MRFYQQRTVRVCIIWSTQHIDLSLLQQENFFLRSKSHFKSDLNGSCWINSESYFVEPFIDANLVGTLVI